MSAYEVRAGLAEIESVDIIGVSAITSNKDGKATDDINALWERFFKDSVGTKIPQKTDDVIYAVYSDYEGDHEAPYRVTIGYRVENTDNIPSGMRGVRIEPGEYAVMSAAGPQPQTLIETWEAIWSSDLERSLKTDFEVYGPRFFEEGVNEVLIHIGVNT